MNYNFTANWFGDKKSQIDLANSIPFKATDKINILEIGSYEGRSTVWFIENYLHNPESTITCIDPWADYSQDESSMNSYNAENAFWKFGTKKIIDVFNKNIEMTGKSNQVIVKQGLSTDVLPNLVTSGNKYEVIFIDGNHVAPFVLLDATYSWQILQSKGIMIFDDYLWMPELKNTLRPQIAIDSFINIFSDYVTVVLNNYRKAIVKK